MLLYYDNKSAISIAHNPTHHDSTKRIECDAPKPGGPLTTRQPAEIYESHVMRPIPVQKWPLGPTHHAHKMYILYKMIDLQLYLITICTKMGPLPRILQIKQNTR